MYERLLADAMRELQTLLKQEDPTLGVPEGTKVVSRRDESICASVGWDGVGRRERHSRCSVNATDRSASRHYTLP